VLVAAGEVAAPASSSEGVTGAVVASMLGGVARASRIVVLAEDDRWHHLVGCRPLKKCHSIRLCDSTVRLEPERLLLSTKKAYKA
jgi:hypothetical protein